MANKISWSTVFINNIFINKNKNRLKRIPIQHICNKQWRGSSFDYKTKQSNLFNCLYLDICILKCWQSFIHIDHYRHKKNKYLSSNRVQVSLNSLRVSDSKLPCLSYGALNVYASASSFIYIYPDMIWTRFKQKNYFACCLINHQYMMYKMNRPSSTPTEK